VVDLINVGDKIGGYAEITAVKVLFTEVAPVHCGDHAASFDDEFD
jgi:hypothetical protein